MINNINIFDPTRSFILESSIPKERELTSNERRLKSYLSYIDKLDNLYVYSTILSLVAIQGMLFGILISGIIYINWLEILLVSVIPLCIYLVGLVAHIISRFLWNKKIKLESKLLR